MQKYQILSAIGEGAYGVVLKCRDIQANDFVAIKRFKDSDEEEHTKKTTMREVKILKMANHPNIVQLKEAFRKKGIVYLVFEYVENNLLEVLQKKQDGLKIELIRKIIFQLLRGLKYLHDLNIIHRDIKPENLLISSDHRLKICDFGFARQLRAKDELITDYVATRWYRPPQLLVGGDYGKEIDLWAVACIMCQLIDGNPLFPGENELDQLFLIQKSLGALPADLHQRFIKNQRFLGMRLPEIQSLDRLDKKYFGKICQKGLALIKSLLKLDPKERMTAAEALEHPFFDTERENDVSERSGIQSRNQVYTSTTNRKHEEDRTKQGKIYNRKPKCFQAVAQAYQSNNNCKAMNTKSLSKPTKRSGAQDASLERRHNRDILMKTEARGFCLDGVEDKQADDNLQHYLAQDVLPLFTHSKKSTEVTTDVYKRHSESSSKKGDLLKPDGKQVFQMCNSSSKQQLPSLSCAKQQHIRNKNQYTKRKPQVVIQKQTFNIKQIINNHR